MVCPPPRMRGIKNVVTEGMNTIVMPDMIPGRLNGSVTRTKVRGPLAPRSWAASRSLTSILFSDV